MAIPGRLYVYTFQFVVVPQGVVWTPSSAKSAERTAEPAQWTIEEIQGSGLSRSPGLPALEGGSSGSGGYATADFQPVNGTTGASCGPYAVLVLRGGLTRWQSLQGTWSKATECAAIGHFQRRQQAGDLPDGGTAPSSMMITAEVTPAMNLSDPNLGVPRLESVWTRIRPGTATS